MVFLINENNPNNTIPTQKYHGGRFERKNNILIGCKKDFSDARHIGQMLFDAFSENPQHIGIIDATTGMKITFATMKEKSVRLALWLRKENIVPGEIISLFSPNQRDLYSIVAATYFVGAIYSPRNHEIDTLSARSYIRITQPKIIFAHESKVDVIKEASTLENHDCKIIILGAKAGFESFDEILNKQTNEEIESFKVISEINPDSICSIAFSSGTTGTPKVIPHSFEQIKVQAITPILEEDVGNDIHLCYFHHCWGINLRYTLSFIVNQTTQIYNQPFDPEKTLGIIQKYKVSTVSLDTYKFMLLCTDNIEGKYNLDTVKMIIPIGTRVTIKSMQKIQNRFPNALISKRMGTTETSELTRYTRECRNLLSEGIIGPNIQLAIKDLKTNENLGPNEVGEFCVKTAAAISGYYKPSAGTPQPFDQKGWFHSGDEAYYDENGEIIMLGRMKDIIRYRDTDIHPAHVEDLLLALPDVAEAAVIGVPHDIDVERPIAFIRRIPGSQITKDAISEVALKLEYSDTLENAIEFIDEMPRNTNGKIDKKVLAELAKKYYEC